MDLRSVKYGVDLVRLVESYGGQLKQFGREWRGVCPLHGGDNPSGFKVFQDRVGDWKWVCYSGSCGHGDAIDFTMKVKNISFLEAVRDLGGDQSPISAADIARIAAERAERQAKALEQQIAQAQRVLDDLRQTQVWMKYHDALDNTTRAAWAKRGIPETWQDFWTLGYDPDHVFFVKGEEYHTPTLTIPVYDDNMEILNIRHRLLVPPEQGDKYRPEKSGLPAQIFQADPGSTAEHVLVVEGEIKAMVSFLTLDSAKVQVLGISGKTNWKVALPKLAEAGRVYILLDPDADANAAQFAAEIGEKARVVHLNEKVDDAINRGALTANGLRYLLRTAVKGDAI